MLQYNLGSGSVRIASDAIDKNKEWHTVRAGRQRKEGYLYVDSQKQNGQSPGSLSGLNLNTPLYVGGLPAEVQMPNVVNFRRGLQGAIYGLAIRFGERTHRNPFIKLAASKNISNPDTEWAVKTGRSVGQSDYDQCMPRNDTLCKNGGACVQQGATFFCICSGNWTGLYCANLRAPCYDYNPCVSGSICRPESAGLKCDCPLGKTGVHCERGEATSILRK